jgi:hypothetical protein
MRTHVLNPQLSLCLTIIMACCWLATAGPLDPPAGPVTSTGRFGPRTEIESLPVTISSPGSYYLTRDFVSPSGGITLDTNDVTIDLNGFSLIGVTGNAIQQGTGGNYVTVKNGTIRGSTDTSVNLPGRDGIHIENLTVESSLNSGILVGSDSVVKNCIALRCVSNGIEGASRVLVSGCVASANQSAGITLAGDSVVVDCIARGNIGAGIQASAASTVRGCTAASNGAAGINSLNSLIDGNNSINNSPDYSTAGSTCGVNHGSGCGV